MALHEHVVEGPARGGTDHLRVEVVPESLELTPEGEAADEGNCGAQQARRVSVTPVDLSPHSFWEQPRSEREAAFAQLRAEAPVTWQAQPESPLVQTEELTGGYWAVVRHADIRAVSRDAATFCSGRGVMFEDAPQEFLDAAQSFLAMDDPRHAKIRGLVGRAFAPRHVRTIEDGIRADARTIASELEDGATGDFVQRVAKRLPLMTIMRMLGAPPDDHERLVHFADAMVSWNDADFRAGREPIAVIGEAIAVLHEAASAIAAERRESPADDLITALVQAEVDGDRLSDFDIASFFVLLSVAGNDTTRHTTSHAMRALCVFPDQRAALLEDLPGGIETAVEEFVRWASPVMTFRRTATRDAEVAGQRVSEGEKVVLFYASGNRDEAAFEAPDRLDVSRHPNHHVGFGGGGPHYCMGAAMARTQLKAIFSELLTAFPELEVGEPRYLAGNFVDGVSSMAMDAGRRTAPVRSARRG
jgi:cytochrome P450